jgi:hypothetical protein
MIPGTVQRVSGTERPHLSKWGIPFVWHIPRSWGGREVARVPLNLLRYAGETRHTKPLLRLVYHDMSL